MAPLTVVATATTGLHCPFSGCRHPAYRSDLLSLQPAMGSLIKKRRKRMRKKKHKKMLKATRWQRRAGK